MDTSGVNISRPMDIPLPPDPPREGYLKTHGPALIASGYKIVPIAPGTKFPRMKSWLKTDFNSMDLSRKFRGFGVGVKTGDIVAVDIDCTDPNVVASTIAWCERHVGETLIRIGRAPRAMLFYRSDTPRQKAVSQLWVSPDGEDHRVELLGLGQQFVAYAIHPGTGLPYKWTNADLTNTPLAALPVMGRARRAELLAHFERTVPTDWQVRPPTVRGNGANRAGKNPHAELWLLEAALVVIPREYADAYDSWIRVGAALHTATTGSAEGLWLWDEWSQGSAKYEGGTPEKWRSFATSSETRAGAGTIFHMANNADASWRSKALAARAAALATSRRPAQYQVGGIVFDINDLADRLRTARGPA